MIKYASVLQADFNVISFNLIGDGAASQISVNLTLPPFIVNFQDATPTSFKVTVGHESITAVASLASNASGDILTVTLSEPVPADMELNVNVTCEYSGV